MWIGQSAGLIDAIEPAAELVPRIVAEAEEVLEGISSASR
jgi:hypothetical protein